VRKKKNIRYSLEGYEDKNEDKNEDKTKTKTTNRTHSKMTTVDYIYVLSSK
jgi:hypothetical protein